MLFLRPGIVKRFVERMPFYFGCIGVCPYGVFGAAFHVLVVYHPIVRAE